MVFTVLESGNANGEIYAPSTTSFPQAFAKADNTLTESQAQYHVYDTLTWANFLVRVTVNDATSTTVIRTRINGANGNMSISVAQTLLGEFEDTSNSESLTDGDLINYSLLRGLGGVNWRLSYFSTTFDHASQGINYMVGRLITMNAVAGQRFCILSNEVQALTSEVLTQITFNFAATIDKFRINMQVNTFNIGQLGCRSRINGADGNLLINIAAGLTGEFEDTVNSDAIVAGDEVNLSFLESATAGSTTFSTQVRLIGGTTEAYIRTHVGTDALNDGDTRFTLLEGFGHPSTESNCQMSVRATSITINNLFVRVITNSLTTVLTVVNRINGADGSLSIAIAAGLTGYFEDIGPEDTIGIGDNGNTSMSAPAGAGSMTFTSLGVQLAEIPAVLFTARKYPNPDSIEVADRFASSGIKYPIPITLVIAQRLRNSARKYPRPES